MARASGATKQPAKLAAARPRTSPTDHDREKRVLDNAARRVPVWQVSVVAALLTLSESPGVAVDRIELVLGQVPDPVRHAVKLHRRGEWRPL